MSEKKKDKKSSIESINRFNKSLIETRTVLIFGPIDNQLSNKVIKNLLLLENLHSGKEIRIIINSPGGEINSGFALFDMIKYINCPITTIITGLAASMGSVLSLVADKGWRLILPNAKIMIHQPLLGGVVASASDISIHTKEIINSKKQIAKIYANSTKKSIEQIIKDIDRDYWFTANEALKYGLVDKIITSKNDLKKFRIIK